MGRVATRPYWRALLALTAGALRLPPQLARSAWHCGLAAHTRLGSLPPDPTMLTHRLCCACGADCRASLALSCKKWLSFFRVDVFLRGSMTIPTLNRRNFWRVCTQGSEGPRQTKLNESPLYSRRRYDSFW